MGRELRMINRVLLGGALVATAACGETDGFQPEVPELIGDAVAYGIWAPGANDTCSAAIHDQYSVIGPDGYRYPTWHPAVDPATGCTFGHEHGRDPSGSDLFQEVGSIPFGLANQHLVAGGFGAPRNEDHVGHKVEWENDVRMSVADGGSAAFEVVCDVLVKLHQGTHSPDAFTNNMHEVAYHIRCSDGTGFSATALTPIGTPGELIVGCDTDRHITAGTANPPISPTGGGQRRIPEVACIDDRVLNPSDGRPRFDAALHENWEISVSLRTQSGRTFVSFNPYFQVRDPSRYFDPAAPASMARPIDLCYLPEIQGRDRCEGLPASPISWDDPRSPFKGVRRFVDINSNNVRNADGPNVWYTDALGRNGRTEPFPGAIRQWVAKRDNSGFNIQGGLLGRERDYNGMGVHAPN